MSRDRPDLISTDVSSGIVYQTFGAVPTTARDEAEQMVTQLSQVAAKKPVSSRVKIKRDHGREPAQRFVAQGNMAVSGTPIRAEAAASTAIEAIHRLANGLEEKLARVGERRRKALRRPPSPGPRRDWADSSAGNRIAYTPRPPEQRSLVRRKTYPSLERMSIDEGLAALDLRDYKFFVFTDEADDKTTVVYDRDGGKGLQKLDGSVPERESINPDIHLNDNEAPSLAVAEAVSCLNSSGKPFMFFVDTTRDAGCVLYRRYDGHYGLLVPQASNV